MRPLAFVLAALLAVPAGAFDPRSPEEIAKQIKKDAQVLKGAGAGKAVCKGSGPDEECRCPGPGSKKLKLTLYAPFNTTHEFILDNKMAATLAYGRANVLVDETKSGLVRGITVVRTGKDPAWDPCFGQAFERVHDVEDMCLVIKDALKQEPPTPRSLPVFYMLMTDSRYFAAKRRHYQEAFDRTKNGDYPDAKCRPSKNDVDQIPSRGFVEVFMQTNGSHANGVTFGNGLKATCAANNVEGLPDTPLVVINVEPEQKHDHVLAHEVGHSIGRFAELEGNARAKSWFDDIADPEKKVHNVMVTQREVTRKEIEANKVLNPFQIRAICESPLLGD